jgi:hypothetical protein
MQERTLGMLLEMGERVERAKSEERRAVGASTSMRSAEEIARDMVDIDMSLCTGTYFAVIRDRTADVDLCLEDCSTEAGARDSAKTAGGIIARLIMQRDAEHAAIAGESASGRVWAGRVRDDGSVVIYAGNVPVAGLGAAEVQKLAAEALAAQQPRDLASPESRDQAHVEAIDHYREGLCRIWQGEADPRSIAADYLGEDPMPQSRDLVTEETPTEQEARHRRALRAARGEAHEAAAWADEQPLDLAGRIRVLVQEYAGRWADADDGAADERLHDLMERLVQAAAFARRGASLALLIDDMRAAHPAAAAYLEAIVRECAAQERR